MKKTFLKVAVVLLTAVVTMSCSKDGVMGPQGPAGLDGTNGNANVIGTNTITTTSSDWTSYSGGGLWQISFSAASISQSVVDRGIVSVFKSNSAGAWTAMPYTIVNQSWTFTFGVGFVNIAVANTSSGSITNPGSQTFRVVIISPSNRMANPNTDWNDYNQVKAVLHLQE